MGYRMLNIVCLKKQRDVSLKESIISEASTQELPLLENVKLRCLIRDGQIVSD